MVDTHRQMGEPCGYPGFLQCHVAFWIWKTVPIILLTISTFGNVLAIVCLFRKTFRRFSSTVYLLFLAFSDLIHIWTALLTSYLQFAYNYDALSLSNFHCMTLHWIIFTSGSFSTWILVTMTIERTLAISFPLHIKSIMTRKVTILSCSVLLVILVIGNGHHAIGQRLQPALHNTNSSTNASNLVCVATGVFYAKFQREVWPILMFVTCNLLPMIIIICGNLTIVCKIRQQGKLRRSLAGIESSVSSENDAKATRLLFVLSIMFLVTMTPFFIFNIVYPAVHRYLDDAGFAYFQLAYAVAIMLLDCNQTFNFFLYVLSGSVFKTELSQLTAEVSTKVRSCLGRNTKNQRDISMGNVWNIST